MIFHFVNTLAALLLSPPDATRLACRLERYEPCSELLDIMRVESRGVAVGEHTAHARRVSGGVFWRRAVEAGLLHPEKCEVHQSTDRGEGWGPRGAHGLVAAYSVHLLGECVPAAALDVPLVSAVVTARRLRALRSRYGLKTVDARARAWRVGVGHVKQAGES